MASEKSQRDRSGTRRVPSTERVLDFLLAELDAGRLTPGERVNAARLAATLGLSAAPVREALSVLAGRGVIDLLPDRGAIVRSMSAREYRQLWALIAAVGSVGLTAAAAAIKAGADPAELEACFAAINAEPLAQAPLAFILKLNEWHYSANRLGGNPFVTEALERLGVPYWDRFLVKLIDVRANIAGYLANYRRMHEAVVAGDGPAAAAILQYHAAWSIEISLQAETAPAKPARRRGPPAPS